MGEALGYLEQWWMTDWFWSFEDGHLSVGLMACLISFAEVESHPVCMLLIQMLHQIQRAFAQCLADRVEKYKYQISNVTWTSDNKRYRKTFSYIICKQSGFKYRQQVPTTFVQLMPFNTMCVPSDGLHEAPSRQMLTYYLLSRLTFRSAQYKAE